MCVCVCVVCGCMCVGVCVCVCVCVCVSACSQKFVLTVVCSLLVMGYVLQSGDIAHKRVHYYYHTYLPLHTIQLQPYLFILALFFSGACETKEINVSTRRCPFSLSIRKSRPYAEAAMSESKNTKCSLAVNAARVANKVKEVSNIQKMSTSFI